MSVKVCADCGFPHGACGQCIAREEAKKQVGYRPGFRDTSRLTTSDGTKHEALPIQMGPQR